MALSLKAEQKNIKDVFSNDDVFVIPAYQRRYSWGFEQCEQLYKDIVDAQFNDEAYFLGTIIVARSDASADRPFVVDGQQRLVTIYLLLKVLCLLCPDLKKLHRLLYVDDNREEKKVERVNIESFDEGTTVASDIHKIMALDVAAARSRLSAVMGSNGVSLDKCTSRFEYNFLLLFKWFDDYYTRVGQTALDAFMDYYVRSVYLLPIELQGETDEIANDRALVIFETINNRGMNLEDADIFKAKLYSRAKLVGKERDFARRWDDMQLYTADSGVTVDDVFRYYYHLLRGRDRNVATESKLRAFFVGNPKSPFVVNDYETVMAQIERVVDILQYVDRAKANTDDIADWLKILYAYTNNYPKYAIVAYLYRHGVEGDSASFVDFLKKVARFVYGRGSTTTIKYEIYNIVRDTYHDIPIKDYYTDTPLSEVTAWSRVSSLRKGFAMLSYILSVEGAHVPNFYNTDFVITPAHLNGDNSIGNLILIDSTIRKGSWDYRQNTYRAICNDPKIVRQWSNLPDASTADAIIDMRNKLLRERLGEYFCGTKA